MANPKIVARITPKQTISAKLNMHTQEIPPRTQKKTATPTTDVQTITFDEGYTGLSEVEIEAVTSSIDNNIQSSNIKAGVSILGVQGNVEPDKPDQTKTANPSTQTQVITPDIGYELASVTINPVTSSIDSDIQSGNIKSGVEILGVTGSVVEKVGQNKTVTPSTSTQTIVPASGKDGISQINVSAVDNTIDENIIASNIKKDVEILRNNWNVRRNRRLKYRINRTRYSISKSRIKNSTNDTSIGR